MSAVMSLDSTGLVVSNFIVKITEISARVWWVYSQVLMPSSNTVMSLGNKIFSVLSTQPVPEL